MKLKRCENLHYYDGDIYMTCPHCAAAPPPVVKDGGNSGAPNNGAGTGGNNERKSDIIYGTDGGSDPMPPISKDPQESGAGNDAGTPYTPKEPEVTPTVTPAETPSATPAAAPAETPAETGKAPEPEVSEPVVTPEAPEEPEPPVQQAQPTAENPAAEPESPAPHYEEPQQSAPREEEIKVNSFVGSLQQAREKAGIMEPDLATLIMHRNNDLFFGWLVVINTDQKGKVFSIKEQQSSIGRLDANHFVHIALNEDRTISRGPQAIVIYDDLNKKFFLKSAEGKTLVYLNRNLLMSHEELRPYDIIQLGNTQLIFVPLCTEKFSWE